MKGLKIIVLTISFIAVASAFADEAPVVDVDANTNASAPAPMAPLVQTSEVASRAANNQQLSQQQVEYLQQMNLPAKLAELQQAIADLRGLIDVQSHQLKQLEDQQRSLYSDLNQRLVALSKRQTGTAKMPVARANPAPDAASKEEYNAYHNAFSLITEKKYTEAISSLNDYLRKYSSGKFAPNAHYWLGELYIIAGDNDNAIEQFDLVAKNYSTSCKAPDALLKLAEIAFNNNRFDQAKEYWQLILKKYPDCSAARVASVQLQKLQ